MPQISKVWWGVVVLANRFRLGGVEGGVWRNSLKTYESLCVDITYEESSFRLIVFCRIPCCTFFKTVQFSKVLVDLIACDQDSVIIGNHILNFSISNLSDLSCLEDLVFCHNFSQHLTETTRRSSILNPVFYALMSNILILSPVGSCDHCSISFETPLLQIQSTPTFRRLYSQYNCDKVNTSVVQFRWINLFKLKN